ncbi:hypothetical protein [Streptomyces sp. NPDC006274]|uniref:hypothetical protein n=1 Tax=Streptomyces sp. NPDC006274 TaxID=3154582 RepID=UPI0033BCB4FD
MCVHLLDDPAPSVRTALLDSPHLAPSFVASMATHHRAAARRESVHAWEALSAGERSALLADPDPEVRQAAALQECRRDARVTAELLRDPKSAAEALRRGLLFRADAERCVAERTHLAALAENPSLPADLVERLAVDPDENVRLAVSLRPELDETRAWQSTSRQGTSTGATACNGYGRGSPTLRCCVGPQPPLTHCSDVPPPGAPICRPTCCGCSHASRTRWWRTAWAFTTPTPRRRS